MYGQAWGYFVLESIVKVTIGTPDPFSDQILPNIANSITHEKNFYDRVLSDMISNAIEG